MQVLNERKAKKKDSNKKPNKANKGNKKFNNIKSEFKDFFHVINVTD
jgi:hypothetical protein